MKISIEEYNITWEAAHLLVEAGVRAAKSLNVRVNIAVVDSGGHQGAADGTLSYR